ncbi:MAG: hypothetical protein IKA51_02200 [Clostridia bacterium]|nr:hypothetical protein [Clostridia bacterium]
MSITVKDVFEKAMALCDYIGSDGKVLEADFITVFRKRAPALCDIAQRELICYVKYQRDAELDFANSKSLPLPEDFLSVVSLEPAAKSVIVGKKIEAVNGFSGKQRLVYLASPAAVTDENGTFSFSDNEIISTLPYYLAAVYMKDENASLSGELFSSYETAKSRLRLAQSQGFFEDIADTVGTECGCCGTF